MERVDIVYFFLSALWLLTCFILFRLEDRIDKKLKKYFKHFQNVDKSQKD